MSLNSREGRVNYLKKSVYHITTVVKVSVDSEVQINTSIRYFFPSILELSMHFLPVLLEYLSKSQSETELGVILITLHSMSY